MVEDGSRLVEAELVVFLLLVGATGESDRVSTRLFALDDWMSIRGPSIILLNFRHLYIVAKQKG